MQCYICNRVLKDIQLHPVTKKIEPCPVCIGVAQVANQSDTYTDVDDDELLEFERLLAETKQEDNEAETW